MKKNEPLLADVRAPWDDPEWGYRILLQPKNLWRAIVYDRRHKGFWAPASMNPWMYRSFLKDLDEVCLRSLKDHGALTARELADWLNRKELFRTKPERTGINRISIATAHDWISLASRRGLVIPWDSEAGGSHWVLSAQGRDAIRPRFMRLVGHVPYAPLIPLVVGGLIGWLEWLTLHQVVIVLLVYALLVALAIALPNLWFSRSERRANPGIAVVAIETLRSAGRPIPSLGGG